MLLVSLCACYANTTTELHPKSKEISFILCVSVFSAWICTVCMPGACRIRRKGGRFPGTGEEWLWFICVDWEPNLGSSARAHNSVTSPTLRGKLLIVLRNSYRNVEAHSKGVCYCLINYRVYQLKTENTCFLYFCGSVHQWKLQVSWGCDLDKPSWDGIFITVLLVKPPHSCLNIASRLSQNE